MCTMSSDRSGKSDDGRMRSGSPLSGIAGEIQGAMAEAREALVGAREAVIDARDTAAAGMSALSGLGTLINAAVRQVTDVDTIKALADPTRIAILRALMVSEVGAARVMSAKELAEELGEPQTKLYRHLKLLEAHGLIVAAETRVVSGIVETRYRAAQSSVTVDPDDLDLDEAGEDLGRMAALAIDRFRDEFIGLALADEIPMGVAAPEGYDKGLLMVSSARLPEAKAAELRRKLQSVVDEFSAESHDSGGVPVEMLIGWYSPPTR
jgi:DNA-binding transcriptional ArsR family regulator